MSVRWVLICTALVALGFSVLAAEGLVVAAVLAWVAVLAEFRRERACSGG